MGILKFNVKGRDIELVSGYDLTSHSQGVDSCKFTFSKDWEGYGKTAVFGSDIENLSACQIDDNDCCTIPAEALTESGKIYVGVFGSSTDNKNKTFVMRSKLIKLYIYNGAYTEKEISDEDCATLYDKIMAMYANLATKAYVDTELSNNKTVIENELSNKQDKLIIQGKGTVLNGGNRVDINLHAYEKNLAIAAQDWGLKLNVANEVNAASTNPVTSKAVAEALNTKQNKLTAGNAVHITNNVLSVEVSDDYFNDGKLPLSQTAGKNIHEQVNNLLDVEMEDVERLENTLESKQDKLTSGAAINISDNRIGVKLHAYEKNLTIRGGDWGLYLNVADKVSTQSTNPVTSKAVAEALNPLEDLLSNKQDKLTAGENITIDENNIISAVTGIDEDITLEDVKEITYGGGEQNLSFNDLKNLGEVEISEQTDEAGNNLVAVQLLMDYAKFKEITSPGDDSVGHGIGFKITDDGNNIQLLFNESAPITTNFGFECIHFGSAEEFFEFLSNENSLSNIREQFMCASGNWDGDTLQTVILFITSKFTKEQVENDLVFTFGELVPKRVIRVNTLPTVLDNISKNCDKKISVFQNQIDAIENNVNYYANCIDSAIKSSDEAQRKAENVESQLSDYFPNNCYQYSYENGCISTADTPTSIRFKAYVNNFRFIMAVGSGINKAMKIAFYGGIYNSNDRIFDGTRIHFLLPNKEAINGRNVRFEGEDWNIPTDFNMYIGLLVEKNNDNITAENICSIYENGVKVNEVVDITDYDDNASYVLVMESSQIEELSNIEYSNVTFYNSYNENETSYLMTSDNFFYSDRCSEISLNQGYQYFLYNDNWERDFQDDFYNISASYDIDIVSLVNELVRKQINESAGEIK